VRVPDRFVFDNRLDFPPLSLIFMAAVSKPLIIVESPAKARTIAGFLGSSFSVESSIGHIRDLPSKASEIPTRYREQPWARLGVDVEHDFTPLYIIPAAKKEQVRKLKDALRNASEVYLATDEDREGESIAWHLLQVLKPKVPVKRMVFHEITHRAIDDALDHPREVDQRLVDAQEARRILDRLVGYEVSPVLWRKVQPRLSAGRVQSVAVRIIVERERERMAFRSAPYWDLLGTFRPGRGTDFTAPLTSLDERPIASGKDFDAHGTLTNERVVVLDEAAATELATALEDVDAEVTKVESKPYRRSPYPPFRTSTLQQEAGRKLRFSASRTMSAAQRLYENGYITYMRTDSTSLSESALAAARSLIANEYGAEYLPANPRIYRNKVKNAQEAHEAIRPAGDAFLSPAEVARQVEKDQARLYDLIWKRTVASQMTDAVGESIQVEMRADARDGRAAGFSQTGRVITFPGFLKVYVAGSDTEETLRDDEERRLPALSVGDRLDILTVEPKGHETKPPARFTEASLIRRLEELGVGRPSTYASIISTIQDRGYVWKRSTALIPTFTAFAVVSLLKQHFSNLIDYTFTARMEDDLDRIAAGDELPVPWLSKFYFGNGNTGLKEMVTGPLDDIDPRQIGSIPIGEDQEGTPIVARVGRYGPYLERDGEKASIPEDLAPDELTVDKAVELLAAPSNDRVLGTDPETGLEVSLRFGRFGPYVQLGDQEGSGQPKRASLFKSMDPEHVTLDGALELLRLPRVVGVDPADGTEIVARNGRYGPYLSKGKDSRSLDSEEALLTVTLEEALALFAQPKRRRGRRSAPGREIGTDSASGKTVVVKDGRFGPYVTDGEVNASLRKSDDPATITIERAAELLALRRERLAAKG
jgi:DNA topoisomerase I